MSFSIYQLKPGFQRLLRPALTALMGLGVTPNQITLLALLLSVLYGVGLALNVAGVWGWWLVPVFMLLRMALNAIDGMLARLANQRSNLGALLNEIGDQMSDLALALPFVVVSGIDVRVVIAVAIGALLAEFIGVAALLVGAERRFDGPMGKSDRALALSVLAWMVAGQVDPRWLNVGLLLMLGLLLWTIVNRARQALRQAAR